MARQYNSQVSMLMVNIWECKCGWASYKIVEAAAHYVPRKHIPRRRAEGLIW